MVADVLAPHFVFVKVVCALCYRAVGRLGSLTLSPLWSSGLGLPGGGGGGGGLWVYPPTNCWTKAP